MLALYMYEALGALTILSKKNRMGDKAEEIEQQKGEGGKM